MTAALNSKRRARILPELCDAQGNRCCYCALPMGPIYGKRRRATVEHVLALTLGGSNRIENLAAACRKCNNERGSALGVQLQRWRKFSCTVLGMQLPPLIRYALIVAGIYLIMGELDDGQPTTAAPRRAAR